MKIQHNKDTLEENLPSDARIASVCRLFVAQVQKEQIHRRYAPIKHVLTLLGLGGVVGLSIIAPNLLLVAKPFIDEKRRHEMDQWKHYNPSFLRRTIHRLHKQKLVEISEQDGKQVVALTKGGRRRILKYALDELHIDPPKQWDGKWRLIIYDVDSRKKRLRDSFRSTLKALGFLKLQESAWLFPYTCEDQVSFLREFYSVGNEVLYIVATRLEDDAPYREYFGLNS